MPYLKTYEIPDYDITRICRYAKTSPDDKNTVKLIHDCISELDGRCRLQVCYDICKINSDGVNIDMGFCKTSSKTFASHLGDCDGVVVFAATVGFIIDRLVERYGSINPSRAYIFEAIGTERVEALCDAFEHDIGCKFGGIAPRFSPGYGELPLEIQKDIFSYLNLNKTLGLHLSDSLLIIPCKSVTAFIGVNGEENERT